MHIIDPFVGTGTFVTRLMQTGLVTPNDLSRKYTSEFHANEIMLLAYYVAAVNIESTYHALVGKADGDEYEPFPGIVLADTFQISESDDTMDAEMFPQNNDRITKQLATKIDVIVANPPYSIGQESANDNNANVVYPTLDEQIRSTYLAARKRGGSNSMFDSYIRAFRWATNRIGDQGIVAFVSNGGWIDGNTADGMRVALAQEYSDIYVYNLRGNQRTAGELSQKEGGKIFGSGSRNTVAIFVGVKNPTSTGACSIHYRDIGDYHSREEKLNILEADALDCVVWETITPNEHGDWINLRDDKFGTYPVLGDKRDEAALTYFSSYSRGLETGRDAWVYNFSKHELATNVRRTVKFFETVQRDFEAWLKKEQKTRNAASRDEFMKAHSTLVNDPKQFSWTLSARNRLTSGAEVAFSPDSIVTAMYRPFTSQCVYYNRTLNHIMGLLPSMYPTPNHRNVGFYILGVGAQKGFSVFLTRSIPDLNFYGSEGGQFFPRYTYEKSELEEGTLDLVSSDSDVDESGYRRVDNVTDASYRLYSDALGEDVTKDDIFYYVYGRLHSPTYRNRYVADLKKMLPRVPVAASREEFDVFTYAGRRLADLHADYEAAEPYPLDVRLKAGTNPTDRETWRVHKMRWASKSDHSAIVYNPKVTIAGIPDLADRYLLGSRSAIGWLIERYQAKPDKASGIVNDPNGWCDDHDEPEYIVNLIKKVTTVAVETMKIVDGLP